MILTPIDTLKTTLQVQGARGTALLRQRTKANGIGSLWWGAFATAAATFVGHYPWFATVRFPCHRSWSGFWQLATVQLSLRDHSRTSQAPDNRMATSPCFHRLYGIYSFRFRVELSQGCEDVSSSQRHEGWIWWEKSLACFEWSMLTFYSWSSETCSPRRWIPRSVWTRPQNKNFVQWAPRIAIFHSVETVPGLVSLQSSEKMRIKLIKPGPDGTRRLVLDWLWEHQVITAEKLITCLVQLDRKSTFNGSAGCVIWCCAGNQVKTAEKVSRYTGLNRF